MAESSAASPATGPSVHPAWRVEQEHRVAMLAASASRPGPSARWQEWRAERPGTSRSRSRWRRIVVGDQDVLRGPCSHRPPSIDRPIDRLTANQPSSRQGPYPSCIRRRHDGRTAPAAGHPRGYRDRYRRVERPAQDHPGSRRRSDLTAICCADGLLAAARLHPCSATPGTARPALRSRSIADPMSVPARHLSMAGMDGWTVAETLRSTAIIRPAS